MTTEDSKPDQLEKTKQFSASIEETLAVLAEVWKGEEIYLVGGCVRDKVLGLKVKDYDFVTTGSAKSAVSNLVNKGLDITNQAYYPKFGTSKFSLNGFDFEISTTRTEVYEKTSRKPNVSLGVDLTEDLLRRDFTVNTLVQKIGSDEVIDLLGGLQDLTDKVLKTPTNPYRTFEDDPLRILRGVRFAVKYGFDIDKDTLRAMEYSVPYLSKISKERINQELNLMCANKNFYLALQLLDSIKVLGLLFPTVNYMKRMEQGGYHDLDVYEHTIQVVKNCDTYSPLVKWAGFFHDFGKIFTRQLKEDGSYSFHGHEELSSELVRTSLKELKFSNYEIDMVANLVRYHMVFLDHKARSNKTIRKVAKALDGNFTWLTELMLADKRSKRDTTYIPDSYFTDFNNKAKAVLQDMPLSKSPSPLSGKEIMEITNLKGGPLIGQIKSYLEGLVEEGQLSIEDKTKARELVLNYTKKW